MTTNNDHQATTAIVGALTSPVAAAAEQDNPRTIWQELEIWGRDFKPWQRLVIAQAVSHGRLDEEQIDRVFQQFLYDNELGPVPSPAIEIPQTITGRPETAAATRAWLARVAELRAVNAIPDGAAITFSPTLTVIYGRNGAGKSGFARILSNVCFSRSRPAILANVNEDNPSTPQAQIVMASAAGELSFSLNQTPVNPEFKRIAVFDSVVAQTHLMNANSMEFKPAGFDVFPEMARVYDALNARLNTITAGRTNPNTLAQSFLAPESPVSQFVADLNANTNMADLNSWAVFGPDELARIGQIDQQILALQTQSPAGRIQYLNGARESISQLATHLRQLEGYLNEGACGVYRASQTDYLTKAQIAATQGADSFRRDFFNGIGSPEWVNFLSAAHQLSALEGVYPQEGDHCLLCHRELDPASITLINRFWGFLTSTIRQEAETARALVAGHLTALQRISWNFYSPSTVAYSYLSVLSPELSQRVDQTIQYMGSVSAAIISSLTNGGGDLSPTTALHVLVELDAMVAQIDADLLSLQTQQVDMTLVALIAERTALRHRQVLHGLLPSAQQFVLDQQWIQRAASGPRQSLSTRPITAKQAELFSRIIETGYRSKFAAECAELDCTLPIEVRTSGRAGETVRTMKMPGNRAPVEILSEGEQRAVALADFLAEVGLNPANAGIVIDDPVNSQDHQRKSLVARRLVKESSVRQVIIFTHDLVFLAMLMQEAEDQDIEAHTHWVDRDAEGRPGKVSFDDCPITTAQYRKTTKVREILVKSKAAAGSERVDLIRHGMGFLRRTLEEIIPFYVFKNVVPRWEDRVIMTALRKVSWDETLVTEIVAAWEETSAFIEAHSHTEEAMGAPPEPAILEAMINRVDALIARARPDRAAA